PEADSRTRPPEKVRAAAQVQLLRVNPHCSRHKWKASKRSYICSRSDIRRPIRNRRRRFASYPSCPRGANPRQTHRLRADSELPKSLHSPPKTDREKSSKEFHWNRNRRNLSTTRDYCRSSLSLSCETGTWVRAFCLAIHTKPVQSQTWSRRTAPYCGPKCSVRFPLSRIGRLSAPRYRKRTNRRAPLSPNGQKQKAHCQSTKGEEPSHFSPPHRIFLLLK